MRGGRSGCTFCVAIAACLAAAGSVAASNPGYASAKANALEAQDRAWRDAESQQLAIRALVEACPAFKKVYNATPQSGKARALTAWSLGMASTKERLQEEVIPTLLTAAKADGALRVFTKTLTPVPRRAKLRSALGLLSDGDRGLLAGLHAYEAAVHAAQVLDCASVSAKFPAGKKLIETGKALVLRGSTALRAV